MLGINIVEEVGGFKFSFGNFQKMGKVHSQQNKNLLPHVKQGINESYGREWPWIR
jgi:hypothetical protein